MITTGQGLRVSSSGSNYIQSGAAGGGMVRYNPTYNRLEIWDGNSWIGLTTHHVDLDPQVYEILDWAQARMAEDRQLEELCRKHPGLEEAHQRLELMKALVRQENQKV